MSITISLGQAGIQYGNAVWAQYRLPFLFVMTVPRPGVEIINFDSFQKLFLVEVTLRRAQHRQRRTPRVRFRPGGPCSECLVKLTFAIQQERICKNYVEEHFLYNLTTIKTIEPILYFFRWSNERVQNILYRLCFF